MRVGPYTIGRQIGVGGMGVVYLAHRSDDGPDVAIKTMGAHLFSDGRERAKFLREARIAARIRHPNVVATVDLVEQDGGLWHVMEYVSGVSVHGIFLAEREAGRRTPIAIALRIFIDLLRGIGGAYHACREDGTPLQIIHRDISPQNVVVGKDDGVARVLDFGIAKTATHQTTEDSVGIRGKVRYIAPEQIKGLSAVHPSDIYSATVVAWEMLSGRPLFEGETLSVIITRVLLGEIPSLRAIRPEVPEDLEALLRTALAGEARERPQDAATLADEIERRWPHAERPEVAAYAASCAIAYEALSSAAPEPTGSTQPARPSDVAPDLANVPPVVTPPRSRARGAWLAVAGVSVVIAAIVGVRTLGTREQNQPPPDEVLSSPPPAPPAPSVTVVAPASAEPPPPPPAASVHGPAHPRPRPPATTGTPSRAPDCRIPTYIDERGISRIRKECIH